MKPKVGLIMPVYKTDPEQLRVMVDSIVKQDYGFENLVLVLSLLEREEVPIDLPSGTKVVFSKAVVFPPHFENVYSQIQRGLSEIGDCKYLCVLPSDDEYYFDKISKEVELAEEHDAYAVYSDYEEWNADLTKKLRDVELPEKYTLEKCMKTNFTSDTSLIRRDVFKLDIDHRMPRYTFWRFWLTLGAELKRNGEEDKIVHGKFFCNKYRIRQDGLHKKIEKHGSYWNKDSQYQYHQMFLWRDELSQKLKEEGIECPMM